MIALAAMPSRATLVALAAALVVMGLGGAMTEHSAWSAALARPEWQPPRWLFAPVWTVLFALAVLAFADLWRHARGRGERRVIVAAFAVNSVFNVLWSALFFQAERPDWALVDIALLWLSILSLVALAYRIRRRAALLLMPYLLWVAFAAILNLEIVRLNGPFA